MSGSGASYLPLGDAVAGRRFAVLGLARSGLATVGALLASGAEVVAWDDRVEARDAALGVANEISPLPFRGGDVRDRTVPPTVRSADMGGVSPDSAGLVDMPLSQPAPLKGRGLSVADPLTIDLTGFAGVVVSPGVPINRHPIADAARAANVPLIGDIELFALARPHLPPHKVVGITGTNGKSTTTALVHHILKVAGVPTLMGGNIGLPILSQQPLPAGGVYVLELSSYQIDLTYSLDCDVAVLLNVTPDHLDRYESFEAYAESKARLFAMQTGEHDAVARPQEWWGTNGFEGAHKFSNAGFLDVYTDAFHVWQNEPNAIGYNERGEWPSLQGPHNLENVEAAMSVSFLLGLGGVPVSAKHIREGFRTYPGLPHRMERVAERHGVLFVNDSKATNPASAAPALGAWPPVDGHARIHWILGGKAKGDGLGECAEMLGNVAHAYVIGESAAMFAAALDGKVPVTNSGTLDAAVRAAATNARPGDVVLLSPACASFDQFRDFEARGDAFRAAVASLAEGAA